MLIELCSLIFIAFNYKVRNYSIDESGAADNNEGAGSKGKLVHAGKDDLDSVADEFRKPLSRLMTRVLDIGTMPSGETAEKH